MSEGAYEAVNLGGLNAMGVVALDSPGLNSVDLGGRRVSDAVPVVAGPMGAAGPAGVHLPPFLFTAAATWTVVHNLGRKPPVVLELASDPAGVYITDVTYPDLNTLVVEWPAPESGKAYV